MVSIIKKDIRHFKRIPWLRLSLGSRRKTIKKQLTIFIDIHFTDIILIVVVINIIIIIITQELYDLFCRVMRQ